MTIGIYALKFNGTDKVYIGQSVNIEIRYKAHLHSFKNKTAARKLQEAYNVYGCPDLEILIDCSKELLNSTENEAIEIYDSYNNGFNSLPNSDCTPIFKGTEAGNAKYSKNQILDSAYLLLNTELSYKDISLITQVGEGIICCIFLGTTHTWISEDFPDLWQMIKQSKSARAIAKRARVSNKLSAESKGIIYPKIQSPEGKIFQVTNAYSFARENSLSGNHLTEVLNGHRKSHKGWRICLDEQV